MSTTSNLPASAVILTSKDYALSGQKDSEGLQETVSWMVPWSDSGAFFQTVVGSPATVSIGSGVSITRSIPLQDPYNGNLFANAMTYRCVDGSKKIAGNPYQHVIFTVTFGNKFGGTTEGTDSSTGNSTEVPKFCRITRKGAGRAVTDAGRNYTYQSTSGGSTGPPATVKLKQNVATYFAGGVYQIQLFQIANIDAWEQAVAPLEGCVNSQPFQVGQFTRAAGTVLLESYEYDEDYDVLGNLTYTGTLNINCSSLLWNNYFIGGQQYPLTPAPYPTADLNQIYV